jgi:hypothetical protein
MESLSIDSQVLEKVRKARGGALFFTEDFSAFGSSTAVRKALMQLAQKGELQRVATGIYCRPRKSGLFGTVTPGVEEIAAAIARRDRARIVPSGEQALHLLGLTTQIPLRPVYLTDGPSRKVRTGQWVITFKRAAPRYLAAWGRISGPAIQALRAIGKDKVTDAQQERIIELLRKEKRTHLEHDIRLAPEWARVIMRKAL